MERLIQLVGMQARSSAGNLELRGRSILPASIASLRSNRRFTIDGNIVHSITLITAYFGGLPAWIEDFIETCKYNPTITWLLVSDGSRPSKHTRNVHFVSQSLAEFNELAHLRLGVRTTVSRGYKICDFKPMYGTLFSDHLRGIDFWGHCDLDVIWGNIRTFFTERLLTDFDVVSTAPGALCGPLTIFRNCESINTLFRRAPYEQILTDAANQLFDERGFDQIVKRAHEDGELRLHLDGLHEYDGYHAGVRPGQASCVWRNGRLFCTPERRELMYYHFAASKRWAWPIAWTPRPRYRRLARRLAGSGGAFTASR